MSANPCKKLLIISFLIVAFFSASAQEKSNSNNNIKPFNVGVSFNMHDFDTKTILPWKDSAYGFSVMLWKGISPKIDLSFRYNGVFPNQNKTNVISKNVNSSELEAAIHAKAFHNNVFLNPFLSLGIGGGKYSKSLSPVVTASKTFTWNTHALGGVGLQFNFKNELYFIVQANYRYSFNEVKLPHNMLYSFGLTKSLYKAKKVVAPVTPDRDKDGVPDNADVCPDLPGTTSMKGCPDRDGDGIADSLDKCPDIKGSSELKGCPDRDGDGIADIEDKCPDINGIARYNGCPITDSDNDGVEDEQDKCPNIPGITRYQGCPIPDSDKDGINDENDKCPEIAGVAENQGCPPLMEEVKGDFDMGNRIIYFATGSAKLQNSYLKMLNEVVRILKENPDVQLNIEGHADNVGSEELNQTLSDNRSEAVKKFIVSKGTEESRIKIAGYGEMKPVADNIDAAGRQQNRRVELIMIFVK